MSRVKCPHCGHWQEAYPYIVICGNCYGDIKEVVEEHFKGRAGKITAKLPEQSETPLREKLSTPNEPEGAFLRKVWTTAKDRPAREGRRLSGPGVIFRRTFGTFFKRLWPLYPLVYLSLSFLMLIGVITSVIGVQNLFPEQYPADPSMTPVFALGIAACLFVFLYTQAAFIFALANTELTLGDAVSRAWQRFGSYVALIVLMVAVIGIGTAIFLIPGVIAGVLFSFAPFVFAKENAGLVAALSKSVRYVAGSWLQIFMMLAPVALAVIFGWYFYTYVGVAILMLVKNEFAFILIISGFMSLPIMLITIFVFTIYDDLRRVEGLVPTPEAVLPPSREDVAPGAVPARASLLPFTDLLGRSWSAYKKRFVTLTALNLVSYLPHAIYLAILLAGFFGLKAFSKELHATGEFGLLILLLLPKWVLALLIAALLVCLVLYVLAQIFGLVLYLLLELAYVYAVADETIGAWGAMKKARTRLRGFFWAELYRNFIVSNAGMLLVPGAVFWVWYEFTPFVFALQREEGTPLSSLWESRELVRGLWGKVFKQLISLRVLPVLMVFILLWFVFAGLPFYWIFGGLLFSFTGRYPSGMFTVYGPHFWGMLSFWFFILVGGFYLPFQKVVMYLLYGELKDVKAAPGDQST
jgi:hypothetical protein